VVCYQRPPSAPLAPAAREKLLPSMGTVGDAFDNAVIESFWARLQTELPNRTKWKTRIELSSALFEYLEIFHNRRHSSLGMTGPRFSVHLVWPLFAGPGS
jgi:transposase InsO family protein